MRKTFLAVLAGFSAFFIIFAGTGSACDYCVLNQGLSPLQTTAGNGIRIDERFTALDDMYDGRDKAYNPGNKETHLVTQITGFYSPTQDLTLLASIPYVKRTHREWHEEMGTPVFHDGIARGLGDITLSGRYAFYSRHTLDSTTVAAVQAGLKLPTGSTDKIDDMGEFIDAHGQPGSGSTDLLLGLNLSHAVKQLTVSSSLLYSVNGKGDAGGVKHEFGDYLAYDVTGIYGINASENTALPGVSVALGIAGDWRGTERLDGSRVENSAGHVVYLNTGLILTPAPKWIVEASYKPAIYHDLGGGQLGESYKANLALTRLF